MLLAQGVLVAGAAICHFGVRGPTRSSLAPTQRNARDVVAVERALGIALGGRAQDLITGHGAAVRAVNAVFISGHRPVIALTLGWLPATRSRPLRPAAVVPPVAMPLAVVATADRHTLDVLAGGVVAPDRAPATRGPRAGPRPGRP
ncbi:hypothetical protein [Miltoncostaea marina]|uniref:hypothetical protein n=1 Tax=Miltoncostaea marina TaxID=2843215 RepID=UPI001C3D80C2|nr:hypothetical protein [Miltoncostaea marina]